MIETSEIHYGAQVPQYKPDDTKIPRRPIWKTWPGQFVRFGSVGLLNTLLDVLLFNAFLWLFPTTHTFLVLLFNSLAYGIGAVNSFFLNKYWTFGSHQKTTWREVQRFALTTLLGIVCNDILIWLTSNLFRPFISNPSLATNTSKVLAIAGTVFVSYLGMRLWVFVKKPENMASPELPKSEHISLINPKQTGYHYQSYSNHSCLSQDACSCMEIAALPTQQLRMNSKIKKIRLVNSHVQMRV